LTVSSRLASSPAGSATREREDRAKLAWLRRAAKAGFDQIDRGSGIEFHSMGDLDAFIDRIGEEVSVELAAERGSA